MAMKIGTKTVLKMQPKTVIWDDKVRGFNARRQFSEAVTFSVFYRTKDGRQRFLKIGRFGVFTPEQARNEARRVLMNVALGLHIGEGVETCMSARQLGLKPTWALGDAGQIPKFPVLSGVEAITLISENDDNGASQRACEACALARRGTRSFHQHAAPRFQRPQRRDHIEASVKIFDRRDHGETGP